MDLSIADLYFASLISSSLSGQEERLLEAASATVTSSLLDGLTATELFCRLLPFFFPGFMEGVGDVVVAAAFSS